VYFATPHIINAPENTPTLLHVPLCDSISYVYNNMPMLVSVTMPTYPWSPENDLWITVDIYADQAMTQKIASNRNFQTQNVTFTYQASYTDLWINTITSNSGLNQYSVQATFASSEVEPNWGAYRWDADNTYDLEGMQYGDYTDMTQYFTTAGTIPTSLIAPARLLLLTCPPAGQPTYDVSIAVEAVDTISTFEVYMCYTTPNNCRSGSSDIGCPAASAWVPLKGTVPKKQTNVTIAIYGTGNYGQINSFTFNSIVNDVCTPGK